jgi:polygalacturonase
MFKHITLSIIMIFLLENINAQPHGEIIYDSINKIVSRINKIYIPERVLNIIEFSGHAPDETGSYDFRADIQRAIDDISSRGGGKIIFPHTKGIEMWVKQTEIYKIIGSIELKSNIELVFQPSVKLYFKFDPLAYSNDRRGVLTRYEGTSIYGYAPLFRAFNAENIVLSYSGGNGAMPEITGDGEEWIKWQMEGEAKRGRNKLRSATDFVRDVNNSDWPISKRRFANPDSFCLRPSMFEFILCRNILLDGFKMTNAPFWLIHPVFSENITFRNLFFDVGLVNNDGFDVESSNDILIENIIFNNHDDNVVIKSGRNREGREGALVAGTEYKNIQSKYIKNGRITGLTENVVVRNCVFKGHHAIAIGSEMSGGVRNIYVADNIAPQNVKIGIFIKSSRIRGGLVENIYIKNLKMNIVEDDVISINPNYDGDTISPYIPQFRNIYIDNIIVESARNGIRIYGWQEKPTQNVQLKNISIKLMPKFDNYMKFEYFNVKGLIIKNVKINNERIDGKYSKKSPNKFLKKQT